MCREQRAHWQMRVQGHNQLEKQTKKSMCATQVGGGLRDEGKEAVRGWGIKLACRWMLQAAQKPSASAHHFWEQNGLCTGHWTPLKHWRWPNHNSTSEFCKFNKQRDLMKLLIFGGWRLFHKTTEVNEQAKHQMASHCLICITYPACHYSLSSLPLALWHAEREIFIRLHLWLSLTLWPPVDRFSS